MTVRTVEQHGWAGLCRSVTSPALAGENDRLKTELAATRTALETAEARERSRIADDLHDILGHALEVVAFKAELADRMLGPLPDRAHGEMVEIQRVARSAMNDVRSLARSRRPTDLESELAGAVALFHSAGIQVEVDGDPRSVCAPGRDPLARVLREAVTNLLRHATPTRCLIRIRQNPSDASITVVNDGVERSTSTPSPGGTGLTGLSRLVAEYGGHLSAGHSGSGCFMVRATVPGPEAASVGALSRDADHENAPEQVVQVVQR